MPFSTMIKQHFKGHLTPSMRKALKALYAELQIQGLHAQAVKKSRKFQQSRDLKLNCGSGEHLKPGWINIDFTDNADLQLDLRRPLPFADQSAQIIYSEHFLEHLEFPNEALGFLQECWRILAPSGILHIGIPDSALSIASYVSGDYSFLRHHAEGFLPAWCDTPMHWLNMHFTGGGPAGHKYGWDFETLKKALIQSNFIDVQKREFDSSLDSDYRKPVTLYVVARKPAS